MPKILVILGCHEKWRATIGIYEVPTKGADSGASPEGLAEKLREFVGTFKFIGAFRKSSCTTQVTYTKFTSR